MATRLTLTILMSAGIGCGGAAPAGNGVISASASDAVRDAAATVVADADREIAATPDAFADVEVVLEDGRHLRVLIHNGLSQQRVELDSGATVRVSGSPFITFEHGATAVIADDAGSVLVAGASSGTLGTFDGLELTDGGARGLPALGWCGSRSDIAVKFHGDDERVLAGGESGLVHIGGAPVAVFNALSQSASAGQCRDVAEGAFIDWAAARVDLLR